MASLVAQRAKLVILRASGEDARRISTSAVLRSNAELHSSPLRTSSLESHVLVSLNHRVFPEVLIVSVGEIQTVMAPAALLPRQGRARDQQCQGMEVAKL